MAVSLARENYALHKLHSLTGIVPIGFYMLQHLALNSFSLGGAEQFDRVIGFFESAPKHILIGAEALLIWLPLLFHSVYGIFIAGRSESNAFLPAYGWLANRLYTFQRWTGIVLFLFLLYHVITTTVAKNVSGAEVIQYAAWHERLTSNGYIFLAVYLFATLCASFHLAYGLWSFCIRWGITVSERSQMAVQRFSAVMFVLVTLLAWGALFGFLRG